MAARRSLMRDRTGTLNRLKTLTIGLLQRHARHRLRQIEAQIASLDARLETLVAEDKELFHRWEILISIPGLGPVAVHTMLADMPELGTMEEGQAASLAGRIPEDWQDKPSRLSHKDRHARWTLKFTKAKRQDDGTIPSTDLAIPFFGYTSHVFIDRKFRLIRKWRDRRTLD